MELNATDYNKILLILQDRMSNMNVELQELEEVGSANKPYYKITKIKEDIDTTSKLINKVSIILEEN